MAYLTPIRARETIQLKERLRLVLRAFNAERK